MSGLRNIFPWEIIRNVVPESCGDIEGQKIIVSLFKKPLLFAIVVFISAFIVRISYIIFAPSYGGV